MAAGGDWRKFWMSSFLVAAMLFGLGNFAMSFTAESAAPKLDSKLFVEDASVRKYGKPCSWWLAKAYLGQQKPPDIVIFGSSQMGGLQASDAMKVGTDLDFVEYHRSISVENYIGEKTGEAPKAFTCALPGAVASDHCLMARALFAGNRKPKLAIIGVSPRDFMDNTLPSATATEPFQFFSRYTELGGISEIAYPDWYSKLDWMVTKRLPMRRLTPVASKDPIEESAENNKQMSRTVVGSMGNVKRGECLVHPKMQDMFIDNTIEYAHRYRNTNPPGYKQQLAFFKEFLNYMKKNDIAVLVVGMPVLPSNRALLPQKFWNGFKNTLAADCAQTGATWIDLSDNPSFQREDFVDTVHLNARGGDKLAALMAKSVVENRQLVSSLNNPTM